MSHLHPSAFSLSPAARLAAFLAAGGRLACSRASLTAENSLLAFAAPVAFEAAAASDPNALPKFSMVAYTGGKMNVGGWPEPVVVDLAGMEIPAAAVPIRLQHDANKGVGHSTSVKIVKGQLEAKGIISRDTAFARDVANSGKNGFPWQCSIGAQVTAAKYIEEGVSVDVNGQSFDGPLYLMTKSVLNEISFVDLGADGNTSAVVAGKPAPGAKREGEVNMGKKEKVNRLIAAGWAKEEQRDTLMASADAVVDSMVAGLDKLEAAASSKAAKSEPADNAIEAQRNEFVRCSAIGRLCAGKNLTVKDGEADVALEAHAIAKGWTVEQTELHVLRASRPSAPNVATPAAAADLNAALSCAVEKTMGLDVSKRPEQVQAAAERFTDGSGVIGVQRLIIEAARRNGFEGHSITKGNIREALRCAFMPVNAGFSTINVGGILSAAANKRLIASFLSVNGAWRKIASIRPVTDFKTVTAYRLTADTQYEKVNPQGEIKHGTLGESSYSIKADTYGKMLGISRQDIINDDLGAFNQVLNLLARGAGLKLNDVFWTAFLANSDFFKSGNKNYSSGSTTNLSVDALTAAEQLFMDMTDEKGKPVGILPSIVLVPTALSAIAQQIYKGSEIRDTTSSKQYITANPHAGKYEVVVSPYLGNSSFTGYSAKAWYLLANPMDAAAVEVAFLNGQEAPTVETADADFNTLGIQMRGYHDFGVSLAEPKAGVKVKGEA